MVRRTSGWTAARTPDVDFGIAGVESLVTPPIFRSLLDTVQKIPGFKRSKGKWFEKC
jgi:hypothetical protein